jgi:hypothetical protein
VTFNNSGTTKTWSGSVSVADGDKVNMKQTAGSTPTNANGKYTLIASAPSPGAAPVTISTSDSITITENKQLNGELGIYLTDGRSQIQGVRIV